MSYMIEVDTFYNSLKVETNKYTLDKDRFTFDKYSLHLDRILLIRVNGSIIYSNEHLKYKKKECEKMNGSRTWYIRHRR